MNQEVKENEHSLTALLTTFRIACSFANYFFNFNSVHLSTG